MTKQQPTLTMDIALYEHFLENSHYTEEEKQEYLETMWNIICEFVTMGFHVHPVQMALDDNQPSCGKQSQTTGIPMEAESHRIESTVEEGA